MRENPRHREPAILVAGRVAGLREHLRWYDSRPLFGRRVLVTRPREQAAELVDLLTALGADSVEAPMIRMAPPEDPDPLLRAAAKPEAFDWIVFTSANAVEAFMTALLDGERDVRALKGPRLCTSGTATADKLAGLRHQGGSDSRGSSALTPWSRRCWPPDRWTACACCCREPTSAAK